MINILVGVIGSGKSTYVRRQVNDLVVNDDAIVNSIHGGDNTKYRKEFKPLYKLIEYTIIHYGVSHNLDVIIDRPNLNPRTRKRYVEIAHALDTQAAAIVFPLITKAEAVQRRMQNDSRGYTASQWEEVYDRMMRDYIPVADDEGFDFIWIL